MSDVDQANQLREAVDDSARNVRNVYLTFLLAGAYIGIIIGSTTDLQLLKISPVNLPILNTGIPIVEFYTIVPWLLILLHFNLLLQLYLLSTKLQRLGTTLTALPHEEAQLQRARLYPFPFTHMLIEGGHTRVVRVMMTTMVVATVVLFPLVLLLWAQIRFLPYHEPMITWVQRSAVLTDLGLLWIFWPLMFGPDGRASNWWRVFVRGIPDRAMELVRLLPLPRRSGSAADRISPAAEPRRVRARGSLVLASTTLAAFPLSILIAFVPAEATEAWLISRFSSGETATVEGAKLRPLALTRLLFDDADAPFHRNLRLPNQILVAGDANAGLIETLRQGDQKSIESVGRVSGLALANRDLRFADLRHALIVNADLKGANLDGADLRGAVLIKVDLRPHDATDAGACLTKRQENARFHELKKMAWEIAGVTPPAASNPRYCVSSLRRVKLTNAKLTSVVLSLAQMRDADFGGAKLTDVGFAGVQATRLNLTNAVGTGLDLSRAVLDRPHFRRAELANANMSSAHLRNVSATRAKLSGSDFREATVDVANFKGADLSSAMFQGARLNKLILQDARLVGAEGLSKLSLPNGKLNGADLTAVNLSDANLPGADLTKSTLNRANLWGANLRGAKLRGAQASGADFRHANMAAADLSGAKVMGADFSRSKLYAANFFSARIDAAEFSEANLQGATFRDALCQGVSLVRAKLQASDLSCRYLHEADFTGAALSGAEIGQGEIRMIRTDDIRTWPLSKSAFESVSKSTAIIAPSVPSVRWKKAVLRRASRAAKMTENDSLRGMIAELCRQRGKGACATGKVFRAAQGKTIAKIACRNDDVFLALSSRLKLVRQDHQFGRVRRGDSRRRDPSRVLYKSAVTRALLAEKKCVQRRDELRKQLTHNLDQWDGIIGRASQ